MPKARPLFQRIIALLEKQYGRPRPPRITDPLEMILLENAAYLASDEQRDAAFDALRTQVGTLQKLILIPVSNCLAGAAAIGLPKKGDVIIPTKLVGLKRLKTFVTCK